MTLEGKNDSKTQMPGVVFVPDLPSSDPNELIRSLSNIATLCDDVEAGPVKRTVSRLNGSDSPLKQACMNIFRRLF